MQELAAQFRPSSQRADGDVGTEEKQYHDALLGDSAGCKEFRQQVLEFLVTDVRADLKQDRMVSFLITAQHMLLALFRTPPRHPYPLRHRLLLPK